MQAVQAKSSGLGVWFTDEIKNALLSVAAAHLDVAECIDTPEMRLYHKGFEAAVKAMALAFGITFTFPAPDAEVPVRQLLWATPQLSGGQ